MNINDINEEVLIPITHEGVWKEIFDKQMKLAQKYKDIENMGDLLETTHNNVDTLKGQKWIKDFAWRVTEELAEAWEAWELAVAMKKEKDIVPEKTNMYMEHFHEELADALHFLVELSIIAGYDSNIVPNIEGNPFTDENTHPWRTVYYLGLLCNTLKNKPWKQTQMLTDRPKFEEYLKLSWESLLYILYHKMISRESIYLYYFKKNKVNQFRQRSKY